MKINKNILWLLVIAIVLVSLAYALINLDTIRRETGNLETSTLETRNGLRVVEPAPIAIEGNLTSDALVLNEGDTTTIELTLTGIESMNASELKMIVDPNVFTIVDISPGSIWNQPNILAKEVNQETGEVTLAVGNGFGVQVNDGGSVVVLNLRVSSGLTTNTTSVVTVLSESGITLSGEEVLYPLAVQPLTISINNN